MPHFLCCKITGYIRENITAFHILSIFFRAFAITIKQSTKQQRFTTFSVLLLNR